MRSLRPIISVVTALGFFVQATGLAYAQNDVQPVPYNPSQPVPVPVQPSYAPPPMVAPSPTPPMVAPAPAYAPSGPADSVYLKGGGMMRGTMIEMLPNDHVTLQLPTGQNAIIEWSKIDHIERGAIGVAPMPPAGGAFPAAPHRRGPRAGPGESVIVHVDAEEGVVLESISPGSGRWALICAAPCDAQVPLGREYRISGEGIRPSRPFGIEAPPGQRVTISVVTGSRAGFSGGLALTSIGSAAVVIGLVVVFFGAIGACDSTDAAGDCIASGNPNGGVETAGAVVTVAGVALLIGGLILVASNARTRATQSIGDLVPPVPSRPATAWLRAPIWHDSSREAASQPKAMGIPLFSHSF